MFLSFLSKMLSNDIRYVVIQNLRPPPLHRNIEKTLVKTMIKHHNIANLKIDCQIWRFQTWKWNIGDLFLNYHYVLLHCKLPELNEKWAHFGKLNDKPTLSYAEISKIYVWLVPRSLKFAISLNFLWIFSFWGVCTQVKLRFWRLLHLIIEVDHLCF
jgi:hypothetical protein